jgi:hypothetical protein
MTTAPYNKDMGDDYRIKILEQQLAEREKQIVELREALTDNDVMLFATAYIKEN